MSAHPFVPLAGYREYPEDEMAARGARVPRGARAPAHRPGLLEPPGAAPGHRRLPPGRRPPRRAGRTFSPGTSWWWATRRRSGGSGKRRRRRRSATSTGTGRPREWLDALAPLGTDERKPFLETAPWLIAIFAQKYGRLEDGRKVKHYYPTESVGLATGMLITALHHAGLATLTHTPSPMKFLNEILGRPKAAERPFLLLVVGYPAEDATVPDIGRKPLAEVVTYV